MKEVPIIFDDIRIVTTARARKFDPQTSHDAAEKIELGKAQQQRKAIYELVTERGPMTVRQMEEHLPWQAHELGKRVGEINGLACTGEVRDGMRVWSIA
ncbi:MAG: hypothetical protein KGL39_16865 [Patescibacteria group bacterium]|nr:hypothetical protein [Patescibacteria group bacterium]